MKSYQLIIFDWDGTLVDSRYRTVLACQRAFHDFKLPIPSDTNILDCLPTPASNLLDQLGGNQYRHLQTQIYSAFFSYYFNDKQLPRPIPGLSEALVKLKEKGFLLAIATGMSTHSLTHAAEFIQLNHLFGTFRTVDQCASKPNPTMILEILRELEVEATQCLMVGDSITDILCAQNAGVDSAAVGYGYGKSHDLKTQDPNYLFETPEALFAFFDKLPTQPPAPMMDGLEQGKKS